MSIWICPHCGHSYDPAEGDELHGISQGTQWSDLPQDWACPDCGAARIEFSSFGDGIDGRRPSGWTAD